PYEQTDAFADGRSLRMPPDGTVPYTGREARRSEPELRAKNGGFPAPLTLTDLERGERRFETFYAPYHGLLGDNDSVVARYMPRPPPALHEARPRALAPAEIEAVIRDGYGLMPSYAAALDPDDRWAIVAYVRALQRSQRAELASLPSWLRTQAEGALP